MDAREIIARLEEPADDEQAMLDDVREHAPGEALVEALGRAEDPWTRMLVADLLGQRAEPSALEPLTAALDDADSQVRWAAADALRKLLLAGAPAGRTGEALLARYEAEDSPEARRALASALGAARYAPAAAVLTRALDSDDPALVFVARQALHRIDGSPPPSADDVVDLLERPTEDGRGLMGRLELEAPTPVLSGALSRARKPMTRQLLADLLGFRGDPAAAEPLAGLLDDPDEGVRASAADALGKVLLADPPPPDVAERVGAAMLARYEVEPSPAVYRTLASALGAARYRPALAALRAALESDDPSLARMAAWGLHWLEGTPPPAG
jgi:HEAT repeat protein